MAAKAAAMLEIGRAALLFLLHSTVPPTVTTSRELVQWALTWSALPETNVVVWLGGEIFPTILCPRWTAVVSQ